MYVPRHFEQTDVAKLHALMRAHPFGTLVAQTPDGLSANHIPFVLQASQGRFGALHGHVARVNPIWRELAPDAHVLAIFHGPQSFVSPAWYPAKRETGKVVPTWNYCVVHARGPLRAIEDRDWLRRNVEQLTAQHEAGRAAPWRVSDAPADYIEQLLGAIVGLELPIASLVGKWKLSQNRAPRDRQGVAEGLDAEGSDAAAALARLLRDAAD